MITRAMNMLSMLRHERGSRERVAEIQNDGFLRVFRHAYENVPFYRDLYQTAGIAVKDIGSLDDIAKLPIVSKAQLREAATGGQLWKDPGSYRSLQTSGSSGVPFKFCVNAHDNKWRKAQCLVPYVSTGRKPWDLVLRFRAYLSSHRSLPSRLGLFNEIIMLSESPAADQYAMLEKVRPDQLQGYPSVLRLLALYILDNGLRSPPLQNVYTDSELLFPETRAVLERAFNADVIDVFGTYETDNIAYECNEHSGYHLIEDSVIVEIPDSDERHHADGIGELVCTVLHNSATPFIRYNLGDLVGLSSQPCRCGRTSRRLSVLHGRANDLLTMPDGSKRDALRLIIFCNDRFLDKIKEFQIRQLDPYRFEIQIVENDPPKPIDTEKFNRELGNEIPQTTATIRTVDKIERTQAGKYKAFIGLDPSAHGAH